MNIKFLNGDYILDQAKPGIFLLVVDMLFFCAARPAHAASFTCAAKAILTREHDIETGPV
ncbi:MAG: hypothetical protein OXC82_01740 [Rhodobacteraceae bacterium]|nr:hypothetical protein [Paracoccaceae bacterium]MCY4249150.1 hypothetical protein [Paracoccaceae bacterium]MCY4306995.1 hypothetical protein [Paracoccaceae bacterium]